MNILFNISFYCLFLNLMTLPLAALPSYYENKWPETGIKNETDAILLRDSDSESKIWVLPPSVGRAEIKYFTPNADIIACDSYTTALKSQNQLLKEISKQRLDYLNILGLSNDLYTNKALLLDELAEIKNNAEYIHLENLKDRRLRIESQRDRALANYKQEIETKKDSNTNNFLEIEFLEVYRKKVEELEAIEIEIKQLELKLTGIFARILTNQEHIKNLELKISELDTRIEKIKNYLDEAILAMQELLSIYKGINAGSLSIEYNSLWSASLHKLQKTYPQFQFNTIETRNSLLYISVGNTDLDAGVTNGVLAYSINGVSRNTNKDGAISLPMIADKISADFTINLSLACPMLNRNEFLSQTGVNQELKISSPQYALTMTYEFPTVFPEDITAKIDIEPIERTIWRTIDDKGPKHFHIDLTDYSSILDEPLFIESFVFNEIQFENSYNEENEDNFRKEFLFNYLTQNFQPTLIDSWSPRTDYLFNTSQTQAKPVTVEKKRHTVDYRSGVIAFKFK